MDDYPTIQSAISTGTHSTFPLPTLRRHSYPTQDLQDLNPLSAMTSQLQVLIQTMSDSVKTIEEGCAQRGVSYPTPDVLCSPETDAIQNDFAQESAKAVAAAYQLIATLSHPKPHILGMGLWVRQFEVCILFYRFHPSFCRATSLQRSQW